MFYFNYLLILSSDNYRNKLIFDMDMEDMIQDGINPLSIIVVVYITKRIKIRIKQLNRLKQSFDDIFIFITS